MKGLRRRHGRARRVVATGPSPLMIDVGLAARRIETNASKSGSRERSTETWVVHPHGDPYGAVLQVQLFRPSGGRAWSAWTGQYIRARDRELAERVAAARNTVGQ